MVPTGGPSLADPSDQKQSGGFDSSTFASQSGGLGFSLPFAYYAYAVNTTGAAGCFRSSSVDQYTLNAYGDLDNDGINSTFEQQVGSNSENELYRSKGFYVNNETE